MCEEVYTVLRRWLRGGFVDGVGLIVRSGLGAAGACWCKLIQTPKAGLPQQAGAIVSGRGSAW